MKLSVCAGLVFVIGLLVVLRLPSVWYRMGGQDEQWYSVPGWTVANEGIPRIPYVITESPESVFNGADKLLYALPPLYSYVQAPFFWLFEPGYGTARLASLASGAGALVALFLLMRHCGVSPLLSLLCLFICGLGRAFYFPWQDTRPDMLCAMLGLFAQVAILRSLRSSTFQPFAIRLGCAGFLIGLAALAHPYAILFALQLGLFVLCFAQQKISLRIAGCIVAAATTLIGLSLWLPLIAIDAQSFWTQFSLNVLSRSGPGLMTRILWPIPYMEEQTRLIVERLGWLQVGILCGTLLFGLIMTLIRIRSARSETVEDPNLELNPWIPWLLAYSTIHLHIASLGMHPAQGYLCYLWAILVLLIACLIQRIDDISFQDQRKPVFAAMAAGLFLLLLVPGSGLRATWTYATKSGQANYNRTAFCRELDQRLPADARLLVSPEYVFEFELLGRRPVNASRLKLYHDVKGLPFDFLIASTQAFDEGIPDYLECESLWEYGDASDPLACHVEVFVPSKNTPRDLPWPR